MTDVNAQRLYGYATGHAEGFHGELPMCCREANESGIAETTNGGINEFPVHEPHLTNQNHPGYVRVADIPE